jgi:DNA recombination protein RmuC
VLTDHGNRFGALNRERMDALIKPMRDQVEHFQKELRDAHSAAAKDRERLKTEIEHLSRRSEEVSREAVALTNALKGDKQKQGAWGEMILERLLEDSGLAKGREYETQFTVRDEQGGRRRPDVIVRLPGEKVVVIDAKVSLVAYEAAVNAEDEAGRKANLRAHVAAIRAHIDELARRDYGNMVDGSVDYVLMFMPVEGALSAALEAQGDLTAYANLNHVGIATPTTLMMALRTIQHVWTVENRQQNAEKIAERAGYLHDKLVGVIESFGKVGEALDKAKLEHDAAFDKLSRGHGNLVGQVDKLKRLGARTNKSLAVEFDDEDLAIEREPAE